jgi:hypothetical protein
MVTQRAVGLGLRGVFLAAFFAIGVVAPPNAIAQPQQGGPPHGPPPIAFEACANHRSGDACSVDFNGRHITGTCTPARDGERLFCRPEGMPPRP